MLFDVKCTLNVSLSVNCAVLVTEQDTYFQIEENVNFCLMKYLKKTRLLNIHYTVTVPCNFIAWAFIRHDVLFPP